MYDKYMRICIMQNVMYLTDGELELVHQMCAAQFWFSLFVINIVGLSLLLVTLCVVMGVENVCCKNCKWQADL